MVLTQASLLHPSQSAKPQVHPLLPSLPSFSLLRDYTAERGSCTLSSHPLTPRSWPAFPGGPWGCLENILYAPGVRALSCCLQKSAVPFPLWKPPASFPRVRSQLMALGLLTEQVIGRDHPDPAHTSGQEAPDPAFLPLLQVSRLLGPVASPGTDPRQHHHHFSRPASSSQAPSLLGHSHRKASKLCFSHLKNKTKQKNFYQCNFFPHYFSALFHEEISQEFSPLSLTPFPLEPAVIRLHSTTSTNPSGQ